jgi:hypothetical protein
VLSLVIVLSFKTVYIVGIKMTFKVSFRKEAVAVLSWKAGDLPVTGIFQLEMWDVTDRNQSFTWDKVHDMKIY